MISAKELREGRINVYESNKEVIDRALKKIEEKLLEEFTTTEKIIISVKAQLGEDINECLKNNSLAYTLKSLMEDLGYTVTLVPKGKSTGMRQIEIQWDKKKEEEPKKEIRETILPPKRTYQRKVQVQDKPEHHSGIISSLQSI